MIDANSIIAIAAGGAILVGGACALLSQTSYVKNRPGLAHLRIGVQAAAGRLALIIPPGSTVGQVEAAIAGEAASVMAEYAPSAKAAKADPVKVQRMIAGALGQILPPGHVVQDTAAPPALQTVGHTAPAPIATAPVAVAAPVLPVVPPAPSA